MTLERLTSIIALKEHQTHRNSLIHTQNTLSQTHGTHEGIQLPQHHRRLESCKRVRVWKCVIFNPISNSTESETNENKTGAVKDMKSFRKIHISELMRIVQKVYEDRWILEVHNEVSSSSIADASQIVSQHSNEEIFIKLILIHLSQSTLTQKPVSIQIAQLLIAIKQAMGRYPRIQTFANLLGIETSPAFHFNPPEKLKVFIHLLDRLYHLNGYFHSRKDKDIESIKMNLKSVVKREQFLTDFLTTRDLPPVLIETLLEQLFQDDYYWNFRFWHTQFRELSISYEWPNESKMKLCEGILTFFRVKNGDTISLSVKERHEKFDGDWLLNTLMNEWVQRGRQLYQMLETAADEEVRTFSIN